MSIPTSRITSTASGRTFDGFTPALSTSNLSPPISRRSPSAIWLRTELPVQSMSTRFLSDMTPSRYRLRRGSATRDASDVVAVAVYSASERLYEYLTPITWLERRWLRAAGTILLLVSLAWTVVAQAQMGESWRVGIDEEHRTPLRREGVFGLSRNP